MSSIKKNFFYSAFLTTANYIFPLITYPYVSRVLGVHNIGMCNFIDSIINYFVLFSMMGISTLGIREVAINKNNPERLNNVFSSLLSLNAVSTFIGIIILAIVTVSVPKLYDNAEMMFFGGLKLLFNFFLIEWFYKGLEDFKYITVRTIIVKCFYVASVFIFVRKANDYPTYYLITVLMIVVNSVINIFHSKKFASYSIKSVEIKSFIKPYIILGIYLLLTSMYVSFNVVYLGFVGNETQVGYYTTATKIYTILIALFTAFTGVMLPRMSSLLGEGRIVEFKEKINKSIGILLSCSLPAIIYMIILAPEIIYLLSGPGYEEAIIPMRIIMPLFFIIGYEQILIVQTMMPLKLDKIIFRNSIIGATLGITLNVLLVGKYLAIGSAIVWLSCEVALLILSQIKVSKELSLRYPFKDISNNFIIYIPLIILICITKSFIENMYIRLSCSMILTVSYFLLMEFRFKKDSPIQNILNSIIKK